MNITQIAKETLLIDCIDDCILETKEYIEPLQAFADRIAELARQEQRDKDAKICEEFDEPWFIQRRAARYLAAAIRNGE